MVFLLSTNGTPIDINTVTKDYTTASTKGKASFLPFISGDSTATLTCIKDGSNTKKSKEIDFKISSIYISLTAEKTLVQINSSTEKAEIELEIYAESRSNTEVIESCKIKQDGEYLKRNGEDIVYEGNIQTTETIEIEADASFVLECIHYKEETQDEKVTSYNREGAVSFTILPTDIN